MDYNKLKKIAKKKEDLLNGYLKDLDKDVTTAQKGLLELLVDELSSKLELKDGNIVLSTANMMVINNIDKLFNEFNKRYFNSTMKGLSDKLVNSIYANTDYYKAFGFDTAKLTRSINQLKVFETRIGLSKAKKGYKIIKGSYIDRLATAEPVKQKIQNYILNNVANNTGFDTYLKGLKEIVDGTKDIDGSLTRYMRQYAYDSIHQVNAMSNYKMAEDLGLEYFVYFGEIIKTSRCFCKKRADKVFKISDTEDWKDDPTLIEQSTKDSYSPLIERGRYNCQHDLNYITQAMAESLGYSEDEAKEINNKTC